MAHRTYLIWYNKPERVPYPIVILEDGIAVANVQTRQAYANLPAFAELLTREKDWLSYDERNIREKTWNSLPRCAARKFMRKHYPTFDTKLL